jgi:hypothetical protein
MVRPLSLDTDRSLDGAERLSRSRLVQGVPALGRCDFNALIRNGKADFPLVRLKWRCGNSRSALLADLRPLLRVKCRGHLASRRGI